MADGMFGAPTGIQAWKANERADLRAGLDAQEALGRIAMQPLTMRKGELEVEAAERKAEQEREFARLIKSAQGGEAGGGLDIGDQLGKLAEAAAGAGLVEKAADLAGKSALIKSRQATQANQAVQAQKNRLELVRNQAELLGQVFGGVQDEAGWNRANALYTLQTGQPSPFSGSPFSPATVKQLNDAALSVKEKADLEMKRIDKEATAAYREANLDLNRVRATAAQERVRIAREREQRLAKTGGGKAAGSPSTEMRREAARLIVLDNPDAGKVNIDSADSMAYQIAAKAKELQKANPALGESEAIQQAFNQAKADGSLEIKDMSAGKWFAKEDKRFAGKPKAITSLPSSARAALKPNQLTTFANGQVWTLENGQPKRMK